MPNVIEILQVLKEISEKVFSTGGTQKDSRDVGVGGGGGCVCVVAREPCTE